MLCRTLSLALAAAVLFAACGCTDNPRSLVANPANGDNDPAARDIGEPLFKPAAFPQPPARAEFAGDPLLVASHMNVKDKVDVPAQRDSKILFIGSEVKEGEVVKDPAKLFRHRGKLFRPLEPGDHVDAEQVVMVLDDREAYAELELRRAALISAEEIYNKSMDVKKQQESLYKQKKDLFDAGKGLSYLELTMAYIDLVRAEATVADSNATRLKSREELNKAQVNFDFYYIRCPPNVSGFVQPFNRNAGESIKALETALQIQNTDTLKVEGLIPEGSANRLTRQIPVTIEPTVEVAQRARRGFHTQSVNGVAISNQAKPLIVSVSDDKTARVWDGRSFSEAAIFTHPAGVRSVACSPKNAAAHYCLTGAEDGKARLWDLNNPKSSSTPVRELEGFAHKTVITSVAFSPNGKLCATADSRDIALWEVETGKFKYQFPQVHLGEISSLSITPQAKLVSASRDLTVRVWSLGESGAKLDFTQEGRSGDVQRVGVSNDGRYFLFDIGQKLRLMTIPDRRTEGVVESAGDSYKFATFATFSSDDKMIVTGSQSDGRVSVWRAPIGGNRATELRQFVPSEKLVTFTCAAVSSGEANPFAVTGTKAGEVYLWPMPVEKEITKIRGTLKFIDQNSTASKQVRVIAEFDNRATGLRPGAAATIVIEQSEK